MPDPHAARTPRRFGHILPWLWVVGPAYLVALVIAMLVETRADGGSFVMDFISALN